MYWYYYYLEVWVLQGLLHPEYPLPRLATIPQQKRCKNIAGSRIWTYAVKHQVMSLKVQITRLNDSAIPAMSTSLHQTYTTLLTGSFHYYNLNVIVVHHSAWYPFFPLSFCRLMDSLIPFTTSGSLVDCVDRTSIQFSSCPLHFHPTRLVHFA